MAKVFSRGELTEKFNLNDLEKRLVTLKYGKKLPGSQNKVYSERDVKLIKEMLFWRRETMILPDLIQLFGIPRDMNDKRLYIIKRIPDKYKKQEGKSWRISLDYIKKIINENPVLNEIEKGDYITSPFIVRKLNICGLKLNKIISLLSIEGVIVHPLHDKIKCIPINEFEKLMKKYIKRKNLEDYIFIYGTKYVNKIEADKYVGIELLSFKKLIKRKLIKNIIVCYTTKKNEEAIYVSEKELYDFKKVINKTVGVEELESFDERVNEYIKSRVVTGENGVIGTFPNAFIAPFVKYIQYRIPVDDVYKYLDSEAKESNYKYELVKTKDLKKLIDKEIKYCLDKYPLTVTINIYKEFIFNITNNYTGNSHRERIKGYLNYFKYLLELLDKEIYHYSDADIELLFRIHKRDSYYLIQFLNYLMVFHKDKCKLSNKYIININYKEKKEKSKKDKVYSFEQWAKYALFSINVSIHKDKALNSARYSRGWLFLIFHFIGAWRKGDILSLKGLELFSKKDINSYINNIRDEEGLRISQAEDIISIFMDLVEVTLANKNKQRLRIIIPQDFKIPFATALIVTENHRMKKREKNLFGKFGGRNLEDALKSNEVKGFGNLKANRTLMSLFFETANKEEGMKAFAYELSRQLRSHKINYKTLNSNTTAQYIHAMNQDGDIDAITYELLRRGTFGYVFKTLISMVREENKMTLKEMSSLIVEVRDTYSSIGIESAATQVIRSDELITVLNEIIKMPITEVKKILKDLSLGMGQSKTMYTQCLKYSKGCPYEYASNCFGCPYNIPSTYSMNLLNSEIIRVLDNLEAIPDSNHILKMKYSKELYKLLSVLQEFKVHFDKIDRNYLISFIDLIKIKKEIKSRITENKLLKMEE